MLFTPVRWTGFRSLVRWRPGLGELVDDLEYVVEAAAESLDLEDKAVRGELRQIGGTGGFEVAAGEVDPGGLRSGEDASGRGGVLLGHLGVTWCLSGTGRLCRGGVPGD